MGCRVDHHLGDRLDDAVVRLRQRQPQQRHSAASLLHAALEHYLDHLDRLDQPLAPDQQPRHPTRVVGGVLRDVPAEEASTT